MKTKILSVFLAVWPYMIMIPGLFERKAASILLYLYFPLTVVVYVWNIINAFKYEGEHAARELAFYNILCGSGYDF